MEYAETPVPADVLNTVICGSSEDMSLLPDSSVHLMVTSPPYNVGKDYDDDLTLKDYRALLRNVLTETYRVLVPGGRACINIANLGRKPYVPIHSYVIEDATDIGYLMRGEIIWDKDDSAGPSTAWGSWASSVNPTLRDTHEYVLVFSKQLFGRSPLAGRDSSIKDTDFLRFTKSVWVLPAESARRVDHPAPFPVELPERLIKLFSFKGDVILDPFMGSGTSAVAAVHTDRHFVGYEVDSDYQSAATERIAQEQPKKDQSEQPVRLRLFGSDEDLPVRRRDRLSAIVDREFRNHLSAGPSDDSLEAYFDGCFDQSMRLLNLSPAWACMGCLENNVETVRRGMRPERCDECGSGQVYQVGSFQSRSSQLGKVFQMAVTKVVENLIGIEMNETPARGSSHDLKWNNVLVATRGSLRRIALPDGSEQTLASPGMNRSDTLKKAASDAQVAKAENQGIIFVVVTNANREGPVVEPSGDIDLILDLSKAAGLKRFQAVLK